MGQFVLAAEIRRNQSVGTLIRCASAFGARELLVVGSSTFSTYGAHGAQRKLLVRHFFYWHDCLAYVHQQYQCEQVIGIAPRSSSSSSACESRPYYETTFGTGDICYVVCGKEGLTPEVESLCSQIVHVPLPNPSEESAVHFDSKISICLQYFASSSLFTPTSFCGGKHAAIPNIDKKEIPPVPKRLSNKEVEVFDISAFFS